MGGGQNICGEAAVPLPQPPSLQAQWPPTVEGTTLPLSVQQPPTPWPIDATVSCNHSHDYVWMTFEVCPRPPPLGGSVQWPSQLTTRVRLSRDTRETTYGRPEGKRKARRRQWPQLHCPANLSQKDGQSSNWG